MNTIRLELVRAARNARMTLHLVSVMILGFTLQLLACKLEHRPPGAFRTLSLIGLGLMGPCLMVSMFYTASRLKRAVIAASRLCPACGYDRTGTAQNAPCPECGGPSDNVP
ncbi:MAG TPA: hypothetical protein VD997_16130 [Phycisphaerales bacterium]|nr:hypothetical protein [Phycisphaerales bacterium]